MEFSGLNCREEDKLVANDCNGNVSRSLKAAWAVRTMQDWAVRSKGFRRGSTLSHHRTKAQKAQGPPRSSVSLPVNRQLNPSAL